MFERIHLVNKRLITHSCGNEILIADNSMYCPVCKEPVIGRGRTKLVPKESKLRVPKVLRRVSGGPVLPKDVPEKVGRLPKHLNLPDTLKRTGKKIVLPRKPRKPSIKNAHMPRVVSPYQKELMSLWASH